MGFRIGPWTEPEPSGDRMIAVLYVAAFLLLLVSVLAAGSPADGLPVLALGLVYVLLATVGFAWVERGNAPGRVVAYFAIQFLLGVAVFLLAHSFQGQTAGMFLLLLLVGRSVQVLPPPWAPVVCLPVGAVLMGHGLLMDPTVSWGHAAREATGMLVATVITFVVSRIAVNERRARSELAAANQRLQAYATQAEALATTQERNRLAREIHDTLAQGFTGIALQLEAIDSALAGGRLDVAAQRLGQAKSLAREGLAEARRSVQALRPRALEQQSLLEALPDAVRGLTAGSALAVRVETPDDAPVLAPEIEADLLRIAQEAVTNVVKHANASNLAVRLGWDGECVELRVRDDGRGISAAPSDAAEPSGFGMTAMRERVERHGGTLRVSSIPGAGSEVVAAIDSRPFAARE
jgi:signal transduction histidine kinase